MSDVDSDPRAARAPLTCQQLTVALSHLPGWSFHEGRLEVQYRFKDFAEAFAFMTRVAEVAEELDHHPEWTNCWNRVEIRLWTHDVGAITSLDVELACRISMLAGGPGCARPPG